MLWGASHECEVLRLQLNYATAHYCPTCGADDDAPEVGGSRSRMARNISSCLSMRCPSLSKRWFPKY
jgi:hypothetical protein